MSYILEALARAERERQQSVPKSLEAALHETQTPRRASRWPMLLAVGLGLNAAVFAVLFAAGRITDDPQPAPATASTPAAEPAATPRAPVERPAIEAGTPRNAPLYLAAQGPASPAKTPPATTPAPAATATEEIRVASTAPAPAAVHTTTGDSGYAISIHVYSEEPAKRFVYLNGRRHVEGDALNNGDRLLEIQRDGVVIETAQGRELLEIKR